jgi:hypothetical protein
MLLRVSGAGEEKVPKKPEMSFHFHCNEIQEYIGQRVVKEEVY